jgi:hypothetical protein
MDDRSLYRYYLLVRRLREVGMTSVGEYREWLARQREQAFHDEADRQSRMIARDTKGQHKRGGSDG